MKLATLTLGTNDRPRATEFYNALLEGRGYTIFEEDKEKGEIHSTLWIKDRFIFGVAEPADGKPATHANGSVIGFQMETKEDVDVIHEKAMEMGGTSEGDPGPRDGGYAAYARDLDKNKLCFFVPEYAELLDGNSE